MKKWIEIKKSLEIVKDNYLLEMSKYRQFSLHKVTDNMLPLLMHLVLVNELGTKDRDYNKHIHEIQTYKELIVRYNKKGKNKTWFSMNMLNNISEDLLEEAISNAQKKYPNVKFKYSYKNLDSFSWFSLY
jgi:hypothetical protein